jgi:hypothetical protein
MAFDYSVLFEEESGNCPTWRDLYNFNGTLPDNFLHLLKQVVVLPFDHYKIIAAYAFIPSALAKVVPYLFLFGRSGSGKSTIGKLIAKLRSGWRMGEDVSNRIVHIIADFSVDIKVVLAEMKYQRDRLGWSKEERYRTERYQNNCFWQTEQH